MRQVSDSLPIVESGCGAGWPQVQGVCPACGSRSLFLASGGYVTCAVIKCPDPTAVADRMMPQEPVTYEKCNPNDRECADCGIGLTWVSRHQVVTASGLLYVCPRHYRIRNENSAAVQPRKDQPNE